MGQGGYTGNHTQYTKAQVTFRTLIYPYGRCLNVAPPPKSTSKVGLRTLKGWFNMTAIKNSENPPISMKIFFMDKVNSPLFYPDTFEMMGDPIEVRFDTFVHQNFKTKITRSHHVPGDPLYDCFEYSKDVTYNDCIQSELNDFFKETIGCAPPVLAIDPESMCNKRFNVSKGKDKELEKIFRQIYLHDFKFNCKTPCTKNVYTSKLTHKIRLEDIALRITFDSTVNVVNSRFSVDVQTLVTRFGGAVGGGRTLYWLVLTIIAASQVKPLIFFIFSCAFIIQILQIVQRFGGGSFNVLFTN